MMMTRTPPRWGGDDEHGGYPLGNPFRRRLDAEPISALPDTDLALAAIRAGRSPEP